MKYLELGTGPDWPQQKKDWNDKGVDATGFDVLPAFFPDVVGNLNDGLPFETDTFDEINCQHCLEHIEHRYGDFVMNEINRVLKPGGIVRIEVPYAWDDIAYEAAGHCRQFVLNSFINYYSNPYFKEMGQPKFIKVSLDLVESGRSGESPARVVRCVLKKRDVQD